MSVIYDPHKHAGRQPQPSQQPPRKKKSKRVRRPSIHIAVPAVNRPMLSGRVSRHRAAVLIAVAVVIVIGGMFVWKMQSSNSADPSSQQAMLPSDKELVKPIRTYLTAEDAKADRPLNMTFVAPKQWRSTRLKVDKESLLLPRDYTVGAFSFTAGSDSLEPTGQLNLENVTFWTNSNEASRLAPYTLLQDRKAKQEYIQNLTELRRTREATTASLDKLVGMAGETGSRSQPRFVNSADGKLTGIMYISDVKSDGDTSQRVIAELAGIINGETIYARFNLDGGKDATGLLEPATAVIKSLTLDTSATTRQAPAISR